MKYKRKKEEVRKRFAIAYREQEDLRSERNLLFYDSNLSFVLLIVNMSPLVSLS
jgi:hypothetical protein